MPVIQVEKLRICYGPESPCALLEVKPVFYASPAVLRRAGAELIRTANDIERRHPRPGRKP